jgi:hypothetical protein
VSNGTDIVVPLEDQFQISHDTKRYLRCTRKTEATFAGVTLPGLFQTSHVTRDTSLVLAALGFEFWGLGCIVRLSGARMTWVLVFLAFTLDVILAITRHLPEGNICELQNRLVYEADQTQKERFKTRVRLRVAGQRLAAAGIWVIAVLKIVSFYGLAGGVVDALVASVLVSYIAVAVIHVNVTGYLLAAMAVAFHRWRDKRAFINRDDGSPLEVAEHLESTIETEVTLRPYRTGLHELTKQTKNAGGDAYSLRTWGVLEDRELQDLIVAQQTPDAMGVVAREGVRHQVEKILQLNIRRR